MSYCNQNHPNALTQLARVLIATIRNLGDCPCPLCLVRRDDIRKLGMRSDKNTHEKHARIDDNERRRKVKNGRDMIFKQAYAPGNDYTEKFLKPESLVPVEVSANRGHYISSRTLY